MEMTFGQQIKERLLAKGMRASELARRAGTTRQNISRLINGVKHPVSGATPTAELATVEKIAAALDWNIEEARLAAGYAPKTTLHTINGFTIELPEGVEMLMPYRPDLIQTQQDADEFKEAVEIAVATVMARLKREKEQE